MPGGDGGAVSASREGVELDCHPGEDPYQSILREVLVCDAELFGPFGCKLLGDVHKRCRPQLFVAVEHKTRDLQNAAILFLHFLDVFL